MALYTERHGMRKPIERTAIITVEMYALLVDCCSKYYNNLAWKFPEECPDGQGCCGLDVRQFETHMKFDIPSLFRNSKGQIRKPGENGLGIDEYDPFALLDLIEFIGQNCKDISIRGYHGYYGHNHIGLLDTNEVSNTFRNEIDGIFQKTGLLFTLTHDMTVERIIEYSTLSSDLEATVKSFKEKGIQDLLNEAIALFKQPNPSMRSDAVEKLWDAFERLKTYYSALDKKTSVENVVEDMSAGQPPFETLFETEFRALTKIGNDFRIRHHETNTIEIKVIRHYDYFFNRCLALVATAIKYLK